MITIICLMKNLHHIVPNPAATGNPNNENLNALRHVYEDKKTDLAYFSPLQVTLQRIFLL